MGAHSTFEDHLKGVQAFLAPQSEDECDNRHDETSRRSKTSRHKNSGKHRKEKRKDKGKFKEKKSKQKKARKRRATPDTEASSSDDDVETQLEKGRAAVRITREILDKQITLKQELRQVGSCTPSTTLHISVICIEIPVASACVLLIAVETEGGAGICNISCLCSCFGVLIRERPSRSVALQMPGCGRLCNSSLRIWAWQAHQRYKRPLT
jgi:hypothetical protein